MDIKTCLKCKATWIGGQLRWATGATAREEDLAGLVCDQYGNEECINDLRGTDHGGDTWEQRLEKIKLLSSEMNWNEN